MPERHFKFWPAHAMRELTAPATNLYYNAEVSAQRYPNKPFIVFYDTTVTFADEGGVYSAMAHASNPYGAGRAAERIVGWLLWKLRQWPKPEEFLAAAA